MRHVLVGEDGVVLRRDVIGQVVVENESKKPVEEREIHLLVDLGEDGLHHDVGLSIGSLPNVGLWNERRDESKSVRVEGIFGEEERQLRAYQVVDSLRHLVDEQRRRLGIGRLDPRGEETSLVGLEEEELIAVGRAKEEGIRSARSRGRGWRETRTNR